MMSVNDLNDDCLMLVFERLSFREKHEKQRVCRRWGQLCLRVIKGHYSLKLVVKRGLQFRLLLNGEAIRADFIQPHDLLFVVLKMRPNLRSLYLRRVQVSASMIKELAQLCPNLKILVSKESADINNDSLEVVGDRFPSLEVISFELEFMCGLLVQTQVTEEGVTRLLTKLTQLKRVKFRLGALVSGSCFQWLPKTCTKLNLIVKEGNYNHLGKALFASEARGLTVLNISGPGSVSLSTMVTICAKFNQIKCLKLMIREEAGDQMKAFSSISNLKKLESMSIFSGDMRTGLFEDKDMYSLLKGCHQMKRFEFGFRMNITDGSLACVSDWNLLQEFQGCYLDISDASFTAFSRIASLRKLWFCLKKKVRLTEEAILMVLNYCRRLRSFRMETVGPMNGHPLFTSATIQFAVDKAYKSPNKVVEVSIHQVTHQSCRRPLVKPPNLSLCLSNNFYSHSIPHSFFAQFPGFIFDVK